jgi:HSP20 family molecular chaperone IbpA
MTNNGKTPNNDMDAIAMLLTNPEGFLSMLESAGVVEPCRKEKNENNCEKTNATPKSNAPQMKTNANTQEKKPHTTYGFPFHRATESIATTIWEDGDLSFVMMELAGFNKENIEITYEGNILSVVARRQLPVNCIVCEMSNVKCRQMDVGYNHTNDDFKVSFENGILRITINNAPSRKSPNKIVID